MGKSFAVISAQLVRRSVDRLKCYLIKLFYWFQGTNWWYVCTTPSVGVRALDCRVLVPISFKHYSPKAVVCPILSVRLAI